MIQSILFTYFSIGFIIGLSFFFFEMKDQKSFSFWEGIFIMFLYTILYPVFFVLIVMAFFNAMKEKEKFDQYTRR